MTPLRRYAEAQVQAAELQFEAERRRLAAARELLAAAIRQEQAPEGLAQPTTYVYVERLAELIGLSKSAIDSRRARGQWREGVHFHKEPTGPKGRIVYHMEAINQWLSGNPTPSPRASKTTTARSASGSSTTGSGATNP